jgi:hypothetical protein
MKLYIYNQNCVMAGRAVPGCKIDEHENPDDGGDWTDYGGTESEMIEEARRLIAAAPKAGAGNDRFYRRVARTILESLDWSDAEIERAFKQTSLSFTREQIMCVARWILAAAFDRIESSIPDTLSLAEYREHRESIDHANCTAMDTAGMALAILFTQTTGEGMGVWDWAGSTEFRDACARFIADRTREDWPGVRPGEPSCPDTQAFAELYANEWRQAVQQG